MNYTGILLRCFALALAGPSGSHSSPLCGTAFGMCKPTFQAVCCEYVEKIRSCCLHAAGQPMRHASSGSCGASAYVPVTSALAQGAARPASSVVVMPASKSQCHQSPLLMLIDAQCAFLLVATHSGGRYSLCLSQAHLFNMLDLGFVLILGGLPSCLQHDAVYAVRDLSKVQVSGDAHCCWLHHTSILIMSAPDFVTLNLAESCRSCTQLAQACTVFCEIWSFTHCNAGMWGL